MTYLQTDRCRKEYDNVEIMPNGWVRAWDGEWGDMDGAKHYPPSEVVHIGGEAKYRSQK